MFRHIWNKEQHENLLWQLNNVIAHIESLILIDISLVCTIPLHLNTYTYTPGFSVIYGWALTPATVYNTIRRCKFMVNKWTTLLSYSSEDVSSWWINEPLSYSSESLVLYGWALTPATVQHKNKQVLGEYITNFLAYLLDSSWEPRLQTPSFGPISLNFGHLHP